MGARAASGCMSLPSFHPQRAASAATRPLHDGSLSGTMALFIIHSVQHRSPHHVVRNGVAPIVHFPLRGRTYSEPRFPDAPQSRGPSGSPRPCMSRTASKRSLALPPRRPRRTAPALRHNRPVHGARAATRIGRDGPSGYAHPRPQYCGSRSRQTRKPTMEERGNSTIRSPWQCSTPATRGSNGAGLPERAGDGTDEDSTRRLCCWPAGAHTAALPG